MELSSLAAELIAAHVDRRGRPGAGFRIRRDADHSVADGLKVAFADSPKPSDTVVSRGEANVFVAEEAEPLVESLTLDATLDGHGYRLVLR